MTRVISNLNYYNYLIIFKIALIKCAKHIENKYKDNLKKIYSKRVLFRVSCYIIFIPDINL